MSPVTAQDIDTFDRTGVVCIRGVVSDEWIALLAEAFDSALGPRTADLSAMASVADRKHSDTGRFRAGTDHWRDNTTFCRFATESVLPRVVGALLGSRELVLYEDSILVKEPASAAPTVWHQDLGYFHCEGDQIATTWCALDPVNAASGALRYVRGSHRWGRTFRPNLFVTNEPIPGTEGEVVPDVEATVDPSEIVSFDTEPGDLIVHHAAILHAAGPNRSTDRSRRAVSDRYCGDDAVVRFRPGAPRKPEQSDWTDGDRVIDVAGPNFRRVSTA